MESHVWHKMTQAVKSSYHNHGIKTFFKQCYFILLEFYALLMLTSLCFAQQEKEMHIFYTIYPCYPNFDATSIVV